MSARRAARGFTLVEVLVALLIVAFGMGAVLASLTSAADTIIRLRERTFAEWVGFNQLSTARLSTAIPSTGDTGGVVEFASSRWQWQQTVTNMQIPGLRRIVIHVRQADAAPSGKDGKADQGNWLATVMGFRGDALQTPLDVLTGWDGGAGGGGGPPGGPAPNGLPPPPGTPPPGGAPPANDPTTPPGQHP